MFELSLAQLRELWNQEKEQYKTTEIGTGVQKFVKMIFESKELFGLIEGKLSTDEKERMNEFLTEAKKKGRRADVVIFVDSDIIIPVEIEKYTHITPGIQQIYNYQSDWTKKLAILTDGNEWWFYNNQFVERKFFINDILSKPEIFLTYWKEFTTTEYYYQSFFEKKGQLQASEDKVPNLDDVREDFFLDITHLIENFKNKLNLKGYFTEEEDEPTKEKKAVEITYAYLIQFILYKVLVDNSFTDFEEDWNERIKSISKAIKAETFGDVLTKIKGISDKISKKIYKRFNDEQLMINDKLDKILSEPKTVIADVSVWLDILLFINRYDFSNVQNEIFGYVYENYLKDLYLNEKKGQYFTDPNVVDFMLSEIGFNKENLKNRYSNDKDSISIIDPSCGSGTFLYNATNRLVETFFDGTKSSSLLTENIINENIFGFDIAEFPLYLAEMNILMRMLPLIVHDDYNNPIEKKVKTFKTRDSISEFLNTNITNTLTDINVAYEKSKGQMDLFQKFLELGYDSFMRDKGDLDNLKSSLEIKKESRKRFDFVIGNPPYVSYNECASQNMASFLLMRDGSLKLNDIYGVNLHSTPDNIKKYRPNPNLYTFFIALGLGLLKDDGKLCYIIPQTMLTASDLDVIRYHLSTFTTIEKIFIFANKMFVGRGIKQTKPIPTSSLILVLKKFSPQKKHYVDVIKYDKLDNDIFVCLQDFKFKKNISRAKISQTILKKNYHNWNFLKFEANYIDFYDFYNQNEDFDIYFQHYLSIDYFGNTFIFDGGYSIDEKRRLNSRPDEDHYIYPKFSSKSYTKFIPTGFWLNQRNESDEFFIGLRQGNQDYKLLDSKYKIIWSYANPSKFFFTKESVIWARNQFNAIGSDNLNEILYLFSLLNSKINFNVLVKNVQSDNEKDILFSLTSIKNFIKIPRITEGNKHIKAEIINYAKMIIEMEDTSFIDIVDFASLMMQKFDKLYIRDNFLIVCYKDKEAKCKIKNNIHIVSNIVNNLSNYHIVNKEGFGSVSDLKNIPAYDMVLQSKYKSYIDDLVYSLYFNIEHEIISYDKSKEIKEKCLTHKFYKLVNGL